jgi:peptidoglycan/LPS O-acetylase OafA/YrhL
MSGPSPASATHTRFEVLDGMRGVAALVVMVYHFTHFVPSDPLGNATLSVDVFFALSGFVIAHSYGERLRQGMSVRDYVA